MIRYSLKCENDHRFESWFQSGPAFDKLHSAKMVACPTCASTAVEKAIMAPRVRTARKAAQTPQPDNQQPDAPLTTPQNDVERAITELKSQVEANSEYVGMEFATQARAIHDGDAPERPIYGEAAPEEARKLLEDGVPVAPLPFTPSRKTN
ncbi:MAG TPA: DUF1178 family protein [Rhodobacteraceae bacterium]|nr:DUF1178 family protein [Paracoccaceae bacterium]